MKVIRPFDTYADVEFYKIEASFILIQQSLKYALLLKLRRIMSLY